MSGEDIKFTDTEKRMLCGDKEKEAYKVIPPYEAQVFAQGFLQARGYLNPEFETKNDVLYIKTGKITKAKRINIDSGNKKLSHKIENEVDRLYEDGTLSTSTLNNIENETLSELKNRGYPCAEVESEAIVDKGRVYVNILNAKKFKFGEVDKEPIEGLRENALDRYYPFNANQRYDKRLLELTEKRMTRAEVVQGTYFLQDCTEDGINLSQKFIIGPPRTIRFGVGVSTEQGPMARVRWSHNRYKSMASILSASAQASFKSQSIDLSADSFIWKNHSRRSLFSQFILKRESQFDYEESSLSLGSSMKWTRDSENHHKKYTLGPVYEAGTYSTAEKASTKSFASVNIQGGLTWTSHRYELFDFHPEAGEVYNLSFDFRDPSLGFTDRLLKLDSSVVKLKRLADSGRGTIVGAVRLNLGTTWIADDIDLNNLPPAVKFYGGGSDDARGFLLKTLPNNQGLGALTKVGTKLELRRTNVFIETLEAFTFLDAAYFGAKSWDIDPSLYYSPGVGMRWLSPIGLVQGYYSRGYKTKPYEDKGNFLYLGIGGTF